MNLFYGYASADDWWQEQTREQKKRVFKTGVKEPMADIPEKEQLTGLDLLADVLAGLTFAEMMDFATALRIFCPIKLADISRIKAEAELGNDISQWAKSQQEWLNK